LAPHHEAERSLGILLNGEIFHGLYDYFREPPKNLLRLQSKLPRGGLARPPMPQYTIDTPQFFPVVLISPQKLSFFSLKLKICSPWAIVNLFLSHDHAGTHVAQAAWVEQKFPWDCVG
jgi:hypothetical protein